MKGYKKVVVVKTIKEKDVKIIEHYIMDELYDKFSMIIESLSIKHSSNIFPLKDFK